MEKLRGVRLFFSINSKRRSPPAKSYIQKWQIFMSLIVNLMICNTTKEENYGFVTFCHLRKSKSNCTPVYS
jgi:hypothetical protein